MVIELPTFLKGPLSNLSPFSVAAALSIWKLHPELARLSRKWRARMEEDLRQFPCSKNPLQFAESDERDEHDEQQKRQSKNRIQAATAEIRNNLLEGLMVIEADGGFFQNFETRQYNGKYRGLQESRVDERRIVKLLA